MLKFYVDSADTDVLGPLLASGAFHGITTNPTILARSGVGHTDLQGLYDWAVAAGAKEVFVQAWGDSTAEILENANQLLDLGPKAIVKVTANKAGFHAAVTLASEQRPVLITTIFNAAQALLAAAGGVPYIAPYFGRMSQFGRPAMAEVTRMHRALVATNTATQLIVASLRSPQDVVDLAEVGISSFAMAPAIAEEFFNESLTDDAVSAFAAVSGLDG